MELDIKEPADIKGISTKELIRELIGRKVTLSDIPTWMLCEELDRREESEGIRHIDFGPHDKAELKLSLDGCSTVYII